MMMMMMMMVTTIIIWLTLDKTIPVFENSYVTTWQITKTAHKSKWCHVFAVGLITYYSYMMTL